MRVHGPAVRELRERSGLSQAELCKLADIGAATLSRLESGRQSSFHPATVHRLAAALRVPLVAILIPAPGEEVRSAETS